MAPVIANMCIRNEADAYLERVLTRLQDQVDLICVTDDCSDDNTVEIASSFPKVVIQQMDKPTFRENEGALRQASWEFLESQLSNVGDYGPDALILAIDADEELYELGPTLRVLSELRNYSVYNVEFFHMWNETQFRIDGGWRPHGSTRVFRYYPEGRFRDRKMACGSEPTYVNEIIRDRSRYMRNSGLVMKHLSYIKDEDKKKKYERYVELDGGEFHAGAHIKSIMDPPDRVALDTWRWG